MSLNRIARFHPVILFSLTLFFVMQVAAGFMHFSAFDRLLITVLMGVVIFPIVVYELWRLETEKKNAQVV